MKHIFIFVAVFLMPLLCFAQREDYVWVMGNNIIDFKTYPPTVIANDDFAYATGLTSIADRYGNLKYWLSGKYLYNKNNEVIYEAEDYGVYEHMATLTIFPFPDDESKYIFLSLASGTIYFSIIDGSNDALHPNVIKNFATLPYGNSAPVIIQKTGSRNYWVIQEVNGYYCVYSLTKDGLSLKNSVEITNDWHYGIGWSHVSRDQNKIMVYETSWAEDFNYPVIDFDPANGVINHVTYHHAKGENYFGYCFTKNNKYMYFTMGNGAEGNFNICRCPTDKINEPDALKKYRSIVYTSTSNVDDMKLGPDGKIYFKTAMSSDYLGIICNSEDDNPVAELDGLKMALPMYTWSAFPRTYCYPFEMTCYVDCNSVRFLIPDTDFKTVEWVWEDGSVETNNVRARVRKYDHSGKYLVMARVDYDDGTVREYFADFEIKFPKTPNIICE
ncbi:MAG: hypothetical protein IKP73_20045 [Bacteroidales bacterium]|nr:hypothetical protein [Bacteroidales bacterium]